MLLAIARDIEADSQVAFLLVNLKLDLVICDHGIV